MKKVKTLLGLLAAIAVVVSLGSLVNHKVLGNNDENPDLSEQSMDSEQD